jgi:hypothetical protein
VAILHGLEVGMTPLAAVQSIAVINGKPSLWGDGFLAVIQGSGLLEWKKEFERVDEKNGKTAVCIMKRKGDPEPATCEFSEVDARDANLANKAIWKAYAPRMRKMRARAFAGRDLFSDVLKGMKMAEEVNDYVDITPNGDASQTASTRPNASSRLRPPPPPPVQQATPTQQAQATPQDGVEEPVMEPEFEPRAFCANIVRRLDAAKTTDDTDAILDDMTSENDRLSKEQRDYLLIKHGECVGAIKRGR